MVINAFASLLTTLVLFALAITWLWQEVRRQETRLDADPGAPQRTGKEMRLGLHTLLLVAAITRAIALAAEALHWGAGSCPLSWGCTLARTFPNLPLLSAHSLLALFFAQLSGFANSSNRFCPLGTAFHWWNGLLYLSYGLLTIFTATSAMSADEYAQTVARFLGVYYTWALGLVACSGAAVIVSFARAFSSSNKTASPGRFSTGSESGPGSRSESPVGPGASPKWGQGGIGSSASSGGLVGSGSGVSSGVHRASTPPSAGLDRAHPPGGSHSPGLERGGTPQPPSRGHSKSPLHNLGGRDTGDPYGHGHATPPRGGGGLGLGQIHYERVGSNSGGFGDGVGSGGANSGDSQVSSSSNSGSGDGALLCRTSTLLVVCSIGLSLHTVYCFAAGGWGGSLGSAAAAAAASGGDRWSTAAYAIVGWDASGGSGSSSSSERDAVASADAVVYLALELLPAVAMVLALGLRGGSSSGNAPTSGSSIGHHYHGAPGTVERRRAVSSAMDNSRDFEKHRGGGGSGLMDRSHDGGNVLIGNAFGGGTSSTSSGHNGGSGRSGVDRSRDARTALRSSGVNSGGSHHHHNHPVSYGAVPLTHVTSIGDSSHHSHHRPHGGRSGHLAVGSTVASHERKRTDSDFAAPYSHAFDSSHGNNRSASNTSMNSNSSSSAVHSSGVHYPRPSGGSTFAFGRGSHLPSVAASPSVAPQPTPSPPPPMPVPSKPPQQFSRRDENGANGSSNERHAASTVAPVAGNGNGFVDVPSTVEAEPPLVQFPTPVSVALAAPQPLHPIPRYSSDTTPVVGNPPGAVEKSTTAEYFHPQPVSGQTRGI